MTKTRGYALLVALACGLLAPSLLLAQDGLWQGYVDSGQAALREQNYAEAEEQFLAAIDAAERFSPQDPRLGKTLNNLAAVYYVQGDYARAVPLLARAAEEIERVLGPSDPDVAQALKNLAAVHYLRQDYAAAEPLLRRALDIWEAAVGSDHPYVATVLSNLAGLYQAQGRFADAQPLLVRALTIWEGLLGTDHPDVVESRKRLQELRQAQGGTFDGFASSDVIDEEPAKALPKLGFAPPQDPEVKVPSAFLEDDSNERQPAAEPEPQKQTAGEVKEGTKGRLAFSDQRQEAVVPPDHGEASAPAVPEIAVYLSSFRSNEDAEQHWLALRQAFPDLLIGKKLTVEEVNANERGTFYRVLASPFESHAVADDLCRQMKDQRQFCQVVRQ